MSARKLIAIGVSTLSIGAAALLFHPASAQAALFNATAVLGQPDFASSDATTTQSGMNYPTVTNLDTVNHRLFVADNANNRVLVFQLDSGNNITTSIPAYVLGQPDFTSSTTTPTQSTLHAPWGLAYESTTNRLFVADQNNQRVMVFDVNPSTIANGENALNVIGEPDFTSDAHPATQNGLFSPDGLAFDPTTETLFAADDNNNRVMMFDVATSTISNGENAFNVLGQPDFTSSVATTTQFGLNDPDGDMFFDSVNHRLFVPDSSNNRVLQFDFITISTSSLSGSTVGSAYSQTLSTQSSQGTVSFSLFSGSLPPGLSLATSTGVISGTPSAVGTSSFTIEADDGFSTGNFIDRKDYSISVAAAPTPTPAPSNGGGGGGLPAVAYMAPVIPAGGFQVTINNGGTITNSPNVTLSLTAGQDVKRMAVSNSSDFASVSQEPYTSGKSWNLCWANPVLMQPADCSSGGKTVYVKFFTAWGQSSPAISATIRYDPAASTAPNTALEPGAALPTAFPTGSLVLDHGTIYLIFGSDRLGFTSWKALVGLGYALRPILRGDISGYQNSSYLLSDPKQAHPWGSWLLSHGTVYYSSSLGLIGVPSWDVFLANGGKASLLVPANAADLAQPRLSPVLSSHDGRVAQ